MKKLLFFLTAIAGLASSYSQIVFTGFGTSAPQPFTIVVADGTSSQTTSSTIWSSSGVGQLLRGTFTAVDGTSAGNPPSQLTLSLTFNSSYSGTIDLLLGSGPGASWGYSFTASSLTGFQNLNFSRNAALDVGLPVIGALNRVAITADNPNFTLDALSSVAVPEPSTYAMLAMGIVGLVAYRRRLA